MTTQPTKSFSLLRLWLPQLGRLAVVILVLSLLIGPSSQTASAQSGPQGQIGADVWAKMSTPQRINSAFDQGLIDRETRLLYLTYAVYDQKSLPIDYLSTVGWYGTEIVREIKESYVNDSKVRKLSTPLRSEMDRLLSPPKAPAADQFCDKPNEATIDTTSSPRFAFSYGTIANLLTFSDYVTSMDTSANAILNDYGWAQPPLCGASDVDNNCTAVGTNNLSNKYPILITDLGAGLFGYVNVNSASGEKYNGFVGDNPNTALVETSAVASCMVLNSNFGPTNFGDATTLPLQLANLNGTTSHEYVHAVQNAWGDPGTQMAAMWSESAAAYFEDEVFDSANSQYIYLYGNFAIQNDNTSGPQLLSTLGSWQSSGSGPNEYANFLFFRYITEQYGGANSSTGGERVIQKFFENVATSIPAVNKELASFKAAVESFALGGGGGSSIFKDVFHNYAIALKFMKDCQDQTGYGSAYCWEEGTEYRAASKSVSRNEGDPTSGTSVPVVSATIASTTGNHSGSIGSDYGIQWVRLPKDGSGNYKIELSSSGTTELKASVVCDTGTAFVINTFTNLVVDSTPHGWGTYNPTGCNDVVLVITNQKETVTALASVANGPNAVAVNDSYTVQLGAPTNAVGPTAIRLRTQSASGGTPGPSVLWMGGLLLALGMLAIGGRSLRRRMM